MPLGACPNLKICTKNPFLHWERGLGAGTARISEKGLNKPQSDEIPCFSRFGENPATTPLDEPSIYAAWRLRQKKAAARRRQ
jgi:hypothetical protein